MKEVALAALIVAALLTGCEMTKGDNNDAQGKAVTPIVSGGYSTSREVPEPGVGTSAFTFRSDPAQAR